LRTGGFWLPLRMARLLRLRHPKARRIASVTVNGRNRTGFDADRELVELKVLAGTVIVVARYPAGGS